MLVGNDFADIFRERMASFNSLIRYYFVSRMDWGVHRVAFLANNPRERI